MVCETDERFTGYGVVGVPYASGHYLVLRNMLASSLGTAYRAIWHRDPARRWTIFTTADPAVSCPRYFGAAIDVEQVPAIEVAWQDEWSLRVAMGTGPSSLPALEATSTTRAMTTLKGAMPQRPWNSEAVLGSMGPMAAGILRSGRVRLHGRTPNNQGFKAAPSAARNKVLPWTTTPRTGTTVTDPSSPACLSCFHQIALGTTHNVDDSVSCEVAAAAEFPGTGFDLATTAGFTWFATVSQTPFNKVLEAQPRSGEFTDPAKWQWQWQWQRQW